ncbi:MAG: hypothetical protein WBW61_02385 [Rhodanobacteraceae bacterium]
MINSLAAGRRLAGRLTLTQITCTLITGVVFLFVQGASAGIAAMCGGVVVALGTTAMAAFSLGGDIAGGGTMLARMLVGLLFKWIVVLGGVLALLLRWHLPALPVFSGMVVALLANLIALKRF